MFNKKYYVLLIFYCFSPVFASFRQVSINPVLDASLLFFLTQARDA